jgi:phosphopantothenoylcysteine decarboxylase/phosphopantothenate--cysteine ligase
MGEEETRALFVRSEDVTSFTGSKADLGARVAEELAAEF